MVPLGDIARRAVLLSALPALACAGHSLRAADPNHVLSFPRDHAAHDAQTEWWHFHGHVIGANGRAYDWFLAFIKQHTDLDSVLGIPVHAFVDPFQVAFFVVTDRTAQTFFVRERHNFPDTWAAHADSTRLDVRHNDWSAVQADDGDILVEASSLGNGLRLRLRAEKPPSLIGSDGYLYVPPRSSTHYYSLPRMTAIGQIDIDGATVDVSGTGWFKHQWGFMYDERLTGWVWFGVQLTNGVELEIAVIQDQDRNLAEGGFATIRERDGRLTQHQIRTVTIAETGDTWRSPRTGAVYPIGFRVGLPGRGSLTLKASVPHQEMVVFPANLWAGTMEVTGAFDGERVGGNAFVEVVGIDEPFGRSLLASGKPEELPPDPPGRPIVFASAVTSTRGATALEPIAPSAMPARDHQPPEPAALELYASRCAVCHGSAGRGDGALSSALRPKPRDLTAPTWHRSISDSELARVIVQGGPAIGLSPLMPAHPDLAQREADLSALVQLIRSFAAEAR